MGIVALHKIIDILQAIIVTLYKMMCDYNRSE